MTARVVAANLALDTTAVEATIHRMAYYDALTGLHNRASLCERFEPVLDAAVAQNQPLALMIVSLDHLQEVNDTLGYV
ncbi:diguanylate cyclase [Aromatoleum diolicum]|uniref:Diguanylate cyclase n=1 Tax=Aromatoleum diolicum TaxID=75796 RepID=A0ABX1Q9M6_9RHOO|nr:diguanylate cyclase [Aromatoleum diolicum]